MSHLKLCQRFSFTQKTGMITFMKQCACTLFKDQAINVWPAHTHTLLACVFLSHGVYNYILI